MGKEGREGGGEGLGAHGLRGEEEVCAAPPQRRRSASGRAASEAVRLSLARSLARSQVRVDFDKLSFLACEAGGAASGVDASEAVLSHVVLATELFEMLVRCERA